MNTYSELVINAIKEAQEKQANTIKEFIVGNSYSMKSPCMHDCVWTYTVVKRTACTITITDGKETKTCRISKGHTAMRKAETIFPLGQYSMCPVLSA